jgi:hypothetical protein
MMSETATGSGSSEAKEEKEQREELRVVWKGRGDVLGCAADVDARILRFAINGQRFATETSAYLTVSLTAM